MNGTAVTRPWREMGFVSRQSVLQEWRTAMENVLLPVEIFRLRRDDDGPEAGKILDMMGISGVQGSADDKAPSRMRFGEDRPLLKAPEPQPDFRCSGAADRPIDRCR